MGKSTGGIKINEPAPKPSSAPIPPSGPQKKSPICQSNRYVRLHPASILEQFPTYAPLCKVPQEINPDSSTQDFQTSGESPKADKPPTLDTKKTTPESSEPPSSGAGVAPSPSAKATPNPYPVGAPSSPRPTESPKSSPLSSQSFRLRSTGGFPLVGNSSVPQPENPLWQYSRVAESLAIDPEFIKAGFYIGRFIIAAMDTETYRANIEALYTDLEYTST
jgi:hypothetical protein